jgi:hypothetical protein
MRRSDVMHGLDLSHFPFSTFGTVTLLTDLVYSNNARHVTNVD